MRFNLRVLWTLMGPSWISLRSSVRVLLTQWWTFWVVVKRREYLDQIVPVNCPIWPCILKSSYPIFKPTVSWRRVVRYSSGIALTIWLPLTKPQNIRLDRCVHSVLSIQMERRQIALRTTERNTIRSYVFKVYVKCCNQQSRRCPWSFNNAQANKVFWVISPEYRIRVNDFRRFEGTNRLHL